MVIPLLANQDLTPMLLEGRFSKPPFLRVFCAEKCERFHKNGYLNLRLCTKRSSVNGV